MKLSEKIEEAGKVRALAAERAECVRSLKDLEATEVLTIGGEYQMTDIKMGDGPGFVAARELLLNQIQWFNGELSKMGIVVDLADDQTGFETDDREDEDEEADTSEVPE